MKLLEQMKEQLSTKKIKIVFPEGTDTRVLNASARLSQTDYIEPIVLGSRVAVEDVAEKTEIDISGLTLIDPEKSDLVDELTSALVERRKGKLSEPDARELLKQVNYFGTMLVYAGHADGLVSGAAHSTADTVRPALQIIKTKPGVSKTSGIFFMSRGEELYVMGDCAINPTLTAEELAEVATETARTALNFGLTPRVALLSFSTKGSAKTSETDKVRRATEIAQAKLPDVVIDGEFQFDAAFVPSVAASKAPESALKGDANVFIFPSLEAGNIGYKMAQRLGGFEAYGPILQGLNKPVNDLSRGCSEDEVYNLAIFTATQALASKDNV